MVAVGVVAAGIALPATAQAVTTVYEIEGDWAAGTPNPVQSATGLTTVWKYNINDSEPAPENPPQENVTITFTAQHAVFTEMPDVCLTTGVTPSSEIKNDGAALVCNLGTRDLGTAELLLAGVQADGNTGDTVSLSASIGEPGVNEATASLPELDIANQFAMDMKFDEGNPNSAQAAGGAQQTISFPWALRHAPGATAGPNTVSYTLSFSSTGANTIVPQAVGCDVQSRINPGYPYSGTGHPAEQTAPFPASCTLTLVSPNVLTLTLTGIDYSKTLDPVKDSSRAGTALPVEWDVVAAGLLNVQVNWTGATTVSFTSSAPTYTSALGESSRDDTANNGNERALVRGNWSGGWELANMDPPSNGSIWTDTYRAMAGQRVLAQSGIRPPTGTEPSTAVCTILDSKYVTFQNSAMGPIENGVVSPYPGIVYEYYTGNGTGNIVNPASPSYNPNDFRCDGTTGSVWTTTLPADLSTVKAIRATIPASAASTIPEAVAFMRTYSQVKPDVAVGQDVWTWTSYKFGTNDWVNPTRTMNASDVPPSGTKTPDSRYPYTAGGRDVLRIVAGTPQIEKVVDQKVTMPGATVNYTLKYRVQAPINTTVNDLDLQDVLPPGMTYVPGSASVAPTSVSGQTISWNLDGVETNTDYTILLSATVADTADPGETFTNNVEAELAGATDDASATTRVRDGGYTFVTKTADAQQVPHEQGVAEDGWTVRLTSADSSAQSFTDTIDILPFNGDGRGTSFTGTYELSGPVTAVAGATVYYSTKDPATLVDDPADASNGAAGDIAGNTAGWSTTFTPDATAVRVIGPSLPAGGTQEFTINVTTAGATFEDIYVNRAEARASRTELVMRTSSWFQIAAVNSLTIKKYVQDDAGNWHDAQNVDDYPTRYAGDTVPYRLVVTNTGDEVLTDVQITDDRVDLAALDPLPAGLEAGAVIPELLPGEDHAVTIEYSIELGDEAVGGALINNACAVPADTAVDESCDPAGVLVKSSTLSWEKVNAGETNEYLAGSEWSLTPVDENGDPVGSAIPVADCVENAAADCAGPDTHPEAGRFRITGLTAGDYVVIETRAPAGYVLDDTPHAITVRGDTAFEVPFENEQRPGLDIPLTGGVGSFSILLGSGIAAVAALTLMALRRRKAAA